MTSFSLVNTALCRLLQAFAGCGAPGGQARRVPEDSNPPHPPPPFHLQDDLHKHPSGGTSPPQKANADTSLTQKAGTSGVKPAVLQEAVLK